MSLNADSFRRMAFMARSGTSRRWLLRGLGAAALGVAGATAPRRAAHASTCQSDNSQDVGLYDGSLEVARAFVEVTQAPVGNLRWAGDLAKRYADPGNVNALRWCSGTLIAADYFLTAGHCLENRPFGWMVPRIDGADQPISRAEVATNMRVEFNYQLSASGEDLRPVSFPVVALAEDRLGDLDYAILRLDGTPGLEFGAARIGLEAVPVASTIAIIGHPQGQPKRVDAGTVMAYEDIRIFYNDLSTAGGSAGSGIFSSPDGLLIGIHTNGGCDDPKIGSNFGLTMTGMLQVSPVLQGLVER